MKLIIEIDEESYKEIKKIVADGNDMFFTDKLISNGTPLDDVKTEIKRMEYHMIDCDVLVSQEEVLEILDNIGKAESEVTE